MRPQLSILVALGLSVALTSTPEIAHSGGRGKTGLVKKSSPAKTRTSKNRIPRVSKRTRAFTALPFSGRFVHGLDAASQGARFAERMLNRQKNPIPSITMAKLKRIAPNKKALRRAIESGALPRHFRLLFPHKTGNVKHGKSTIREVDVHLPDSIAEQLANGGGTRSITNLHGYTSDAIQQEALTNMNAMSSQAGLIALHPQGIEAKDSQLKLKVRSWNADKCCGPAVEKKVDDIGYLKDLHREVGKVFGVKKRALTGESNGAFLTYRARRELTDVFDVAFPVAGSEGKNAAKSPAKRVVPIYAYLGSRDVLVNGLTTRVMGVQNPKDAATAVAKVNGSVQSKRRSKFGTFKEKVFKDAKGKEVGAVREITALGFATHLWPGGEHTTASILKRAAKVFGE